MLNDPTGCFWRHDQKQPFSPTATRLFFFLLHCVEVASVQNTATGQPINSISLGDSELLARVDMTKNTLTKALDYLKAFPDLLVVTPGIGRTPTRYTLPEYAKNGYSQQGEYANSEYSQNGDSPKNAYSQTGEYPKNAYPENAAPAPENEAVSFEKSPNSDFGITNFEGKTAVEGETVGGGFSPTPPFPAHKPAPPHEGRIINSTSACAQSNILLTPPERVPVHEARTHVPPPDAYLRDVCPDAGPPADEPALPEPAPASAFVLIDGQDGKPVEVSADRLGPVLKLSGVAYSEVARFAAAHQGKRYDDLDDLRILVKAWLSAERKQARAEQQVALRQQRGNYTIDQRREAFALEVEQYRLNNPDKYPDAMYPDFTQHWNLQWKNTNKTKRETQDTWDTALRLKTWYERSQSRSGYGRGNTTNGTGYGRPERVTPKTDLAAALSESADLIDRLERFGSV